MIRLTRQQVRWIDAHAAERYHIPGVVLMENAAVAVSRVAMEMARPKDGPVLVVCGGGNNGGDGLAAARHLHNAGYGVQLLTVESPEKYHGDALVNWKICQAMNLPAEMATTSTIRARKPSMILDGIFGTGLTKIPRPPFQEIVSALQAANAPILAIDIPSGLDCDSGMPLGPACVRATRTITFVAEKVGFSRSEAKQYLGQVTVGDIGCPVELIAEAAKLPAGGGA